MTIYIGPLETFFIAGGIVLFALFLLIHSSIKDKKIKKKKKAER